MIKSNTTCRTPWCLYDVIWAPPKTKCNTAGSPYDVIEQLRAGSEQFADWSKFRVGEEEGDGEEEGREEKEGREEMETRGRR